MAFEIQYFISWFLFWILGWGGLYNLPKNKVDYKENYFLVSVYFLFLSVIMIFFYQEILTPILIPLNLFSILLVILLFSYNFLSYKIVNKYFNKPVEKLAKYSDIYFLHLDKRYIISKSFDIFYQQILIIVLIFLLKAHGFNLFWISILFAIMFGIGHIPAFKLYPTFFGTFIFIAAICSSFLFPFLILSYPYGFVYTYIAHWLFYTNTGLLFWIIEEIKLKRTQKHSKK